MVAAPFPTHRLIPSQYPPIGLFDTVATAADLDAVMELTGWTNDRLVAHRLARLPQSERVFGRPNSSIILAAFLHAAPDGGRFNGPDLGAWYAAAALNTAIAEVGHHLRRELVARKRPSERRVFRAYRARLSGSFETLPPARTDLLSSTSWAASQVYGESRRAAGATGILYPSLRHAGGVNLCAYRPSLIEDVMQAEHLALTVEAASPGIRVEMLRAA